MEQAPPVPVSLNSAPPGNLLEDLQVQPRPRVRPWGRAAFWLSQPISHPDADEPPHLMLEDLTLEMATVGYTQK